MICQTAPLLNLFHLSPLKALINILTPRLTTQGGGEWEEGEAAFTLDLCWFCFWSYMLILLIWFE